MLHKTIRHSATALILFLQLFFLWAILKENVNPDYMPYIMGAFSVIILVTYVKAPIYHEEHLYEGIYVACWIPVGALITYSLNHYLHLGPVIAAASVGTLASFLPEINKKSNYIKQLPPAIYCGAFVGMSSAIVAQGIPFILSASIFTAVLMVISKSLLNGVGGKLGTIAFAGVCITSFVFFLLF